MPLTIAGMAEQRKTTTVRVSEVFAKRIHFAATHLGMSIDAYLQMICGERVNRDCLLAADEIKRDLSSPKDKPE